ncbi:MAG: hypothetical protein ACLR3S_05870 [Clostridium fessum]
MQHKREEVRDMNLYGEILKNWKGRRVWRSREALWEKRKSSRYAL